MPLKKSLFLPRGIDPDLLVSQVKSTMPYLFDPGIDDTPLGRFPPSAVLRSYAPQVEEESLTHFEYFRLCLSAHYLTCGTPVPTDVDNQIRQKLWPAHVPLDVAIQMSSLVLESRHWDFTQVSSRSLRGSAGTPWGHEVLTGHLGEWFTVAAAAYCALKQYSGSAAAQSQQRDVFDAIVDEVNRHSEIFGSLWKAGDGLACLKATAPIAHNFGDLDRVMDQWNLAIEDPLRVGFYKLAASPYDSNRNFRFRGRLWVAGELYKAVIAGSSMALENHRHFALRKPKCLRRSSSLVVPFGPFFDDWGQKVAQFLRSETGAPSEETLEVIEALTQGWARLPKTVGYGRALRGIQEVHSDLNLKGSFEITQLLFENAWAEAALAALDEIPSRAE